MTAIDLSEQQALDADPKAVNKINFTEHLEQNTTMLFIFEKVKQTILGFSQGAERSLWIYFALM